jgi:hypothetical protein
MLVSEVLPCHDDAGASLSNQRKANVEAKLTLQRIERAKPTLNRLGSGVEIFLNLSLIN